MRLTRKQKVTTIAVTAGIGLLLILAVLVIYWQANRMSLYENKQLGFSIKYPSGWAIKENTNGAAVIFYAPLENNLDFFQENVNVVVQDTSRNPLDIREYSELAIRQMEIVFKRNIETVVSESTYLDGRPAYNYVFIGKGPEAELKYRSTWTMDERIAYQITYTSVAPSYDTYANKVNRMIRSFKVRK